LAKLVVRLAELQKERQLEERVVLLQVLVLAFLTEQQLEL
jgi:hypothetical protein